MQANNPTLTRILAHPRVREIRPQWYGGICHECNQKMRDYAGRPCPWHSPEVLLEFGYIGENFVPGRCLDRLLELADDFCKPPHRTNVEWNIGDEEFCAHFNSHCAYGPTRADAVIAAIARALNIGDTK